MNAFIWHKYKVKGTNKDTGRKGTASIIYKNENIPEKKLISLGLLPPYEFEEIPFDEPTTNQLSYALDLGIVVTPYMNRKDVSALISIKEDDDIPAGDGMKKFAYDHDVYFSPFIGENALRDILLNELNGKDRATFKKLFPEEEVAEELEDDDNDLAIGNVFPNEQQFVDAEIYDERFNIDGHNGKVRLNFFGVIIKRSGKNQDVLIPFNDISDIHIGISESIFSLNYIRFVRKCDINTYYKPSSLPEDKMSLITTVTFANSKYVAVAENIRRDISIRTGKEFSAVGSYDENQKTSTQYKISIGCFVFILNFVFCNLLVSCGK